MAQQPSQGPYTSSCSVWRTLVRFQKSRPDPPPTLAPLLEEIQRARIAHLTLVILEPVELLMPEAPTSIECTH